MPPLTGFKEECFEELIKVLEFFDFKKFEPMKSDYHKDPNRPNCPCYHFRSEKDFIEVHLRNRVEVYRIANGPFLNEYRSGVKIEFAYDTFIFETKRYFGKELLRTILDS